MQEFLAVLQQFLVYRAKNQDLLWRLTGVWRFLIWPLLDFMNACAILYLFFKMSRKVQGQQVKDKQNKG